MKTDFSKWLGWIYLSHKFGESDPDVMIIRGWVYRNLKNNPPTAAELAAAARIQKRLVQLKEQPA